MGREEERAAEAAAEAAFGERPKETWDCESILTSCSTAYNHPKRLDDRPQRRYLSSLVSRPLKGSPRFIWCAAVGHKQQIGACRLESSRVCRSFCFRIWALHKLSM